MSKIDFILNRRQKRMYIEGIKCGSFGWLLGRIKITQMINEEYNSKLEFTPKNWWWSIKVGLAKVLLKGNLKWLGHFIKLPSVLFEYSYVTTLDGHKFLIDNKDYRMSEILNDYKVLDVWEPETTKIVKEHVQEGMVCLDIGASVGYFTLLFARQVGDTGKVIAIEPTEMGFSYQQENIKLNGYKNVLPFKIAAWDKKEVISIPKNSPYPIWSNASPVDDILEGLGIMKVDFIKVDVDGPEPRVLKGLERTIQRSPNLKMVIEYLPKYQEMAGESPEEFLNFINKYFNFIVIPDDYDDGCWNYFCTKK